MTNSSPFHLVIAGGGVAALEAALAVRDLAPGRVRTTLLAPQDELVYRPLTVQEPFAYASARRYGLAKIAHDLDAELVRDSLSRVEPDRHVVHTESGVALSYDALLVAVGSKVHERFRHATTIDDRRMDDLLHGLIQDVEAGYTTSVAFVAPSRLAWPLPIYELALMTAARAREVGVAPRIAVVTPESTPLAIFGLGAGYGMADLLGEAGIEVITDAHVDVPSSGEVVIHPGARRLEFGRVVALPELIGPSVRGLPIAEHGFIPVTPYGEVRGVPDVYAAGDATDFAVKHGGIAAQQADVAATSIAAAAGAPVERKPFSPAIRGVLLTGAAPRYLSAHVVGGHGFASRLSDHPTWWPPTKIAARYLAPYLEELAA
jgi:sulfide:quinone oxidoreductase